MISDDDICEALIHYNKETAIGFAMANGYSEAEAEELIDAYLDGLC